ncbi:stealth family protein [Aquabacterium sp.]|uniref:stealth family protein n=1 Tax=Aquabacterium sp. TaxID=1872578 RepID=UPI0035AFF396
MKVDIVYTWVDSSDPEWKWQKQAAAHEHPELVCEAGAHPARFANNGELLYSLRSIHKFAPWVNRIHIVTNGQRPGWLNVEHPKINLVAHRDIFYPSDVLPTFSSRAIEARLVNIEGLAERFVYFNDDMFLGRSSSENDFFFRGAPRVFTTTRLPSRRALFNVSSQAPGWLHHDGLRSTQQAVKSVAGSAPNYEIRHQVVPFVTADLRQLTDVLYREYFDAAAASPVRSPGTVLAPQCFMRHMLAVGRAKKTYLKSFGDRARWKDYIYRTLNMRSSKYVSLQDGCEVQLGRVMDMRPLLFCINQTELTMPANLQEMIKFLADYFPEPSPYEV